MEFIKFVDKDRYSDLSGIYEIVNIKNGKRYVGQTSMRFIKRYWHHNWKLFQNEHDNVNLQSDYNEFGINSFEFRVLQIAGKEDLDRCEIEYIQMYSETDSCYNIQPGGKCVDLRVYRHEDSFKKVGEMNRQRLIGTTLPESTKEKMKQSAKKGEDSLKAKLTNSQVLQIVEYIKQGRSDNSIGLMYGVTKQNIRSIRTGKTWNSVTHIKS